MKTQNKTSYSHSNVDMLLSASTLIENAKSNVGFLESKRSTFTNEYFETVATRIDKAISDYLGVDGAKGLRDKTQKLNSILSTALVNLGELKVQIDVDFDTDKTKRDEILNSLGFTTHYTASTKRDQEAAITLLYQFDKNLDSSLNAQFITNGVSQKLIDDIKGAALKLKNANVEQEFGKMVSRQITDTGRNEFNDIYKTVIGIAKISHKFYKGDRLKMDQFSFSKIVKNLG